MDSSRRSRLADPADDAGAPPAETPMPTETRTHTHTTRSSRRPTSYYNSFQTSCSAANDDPPSYSHASRNHRPVLPRIDVGNETLPKYSSSVDAEGKLLVNVESINPLHGIIESDWREIYVVLRGTMLSFHRVKDGGMGKHLRSYTLQHAEVGLAPDVQHTILIPQSRLAHLIPTAARRRAWQKDPDLFNPIRQTILRLRVETDQILLADSSEDRIHQLIHSIGAGIDISTPIDERSISKQCTVPRRRRRARQTTSDMGDPALLAQQERLFREMYPGFAQEQTETTTELQREITGTSQPDHVSSSQRDDDDLDLAMMRDDAATTEREHTGVTMQRPPNERQNTASTTVSAFGDDMIYETSPENFDVDGKWQPQTTRTPAQIERYIKRCMPVLLAEASRASDIIICNGRRVRVNWRMEVLEEWELRAPSYKSHGFADEVNSDSDAALQRSSSRLSASGSTSGNDIEPVSPVDNTLANLKLAKIPSGTVTTTGYGRRLDAETRNATKARRQLHPDMHGVVFCF